MEYALSSLGLIVLKPEEGSLFDQYLHIHAENNYVPDGTPIKSYTSPGVYKLMDANEKSVIVRAEVEV